MGENFSFLTPPLKVSSLVVDADLNMGTRKIVAANGEFTTAIKVDAIYEYTPLYGTYVVKPRYTIGTELMTNSNLIDLLAGSWLEELGQAIDRTTYATLFYRIGTMYGAGDGSTTFNIPDMRGRVAVGRNSADSDLDTEGKTYGEKAHTPTLDEMVNHAHGVPGGTAGGGGVLYKNTTTSTGDVATSSVGGGQPFNVMQPSLVRRWYMRVA